MSQRPSIFVSIASYRDPECQHTVRDLFLKASHPERIRAGICWQYDREADADCFMIEPPYPDRVDAIHCHWRDSRGGCWARAQALSLAKDEDFILQIDAHMRFVPGWDELLLQSYNACPHKRVGLTTTLPRYTPPDTLEDFTGHLPVSFVREANGMRALQPVGMGGYKRLFERLRYRPAPTPFIIANFLFAPRAMFKEVPYDPHLFFRGQEAAYSLRLWTHSWDLFHPDRVVAHHYWDAVTRLDPSAADYKVENPAALKAQKRVWHVLQLQKSDDADVLADIDIYGPGTQRSVASFWDYAGINLETGEISEIAHYGWWGPQPRA